MTQFQNQFAQTNEKGKLDLALNVNTISCEVSANQATALVAGQAVTIEDSIGGVPKVLAAAADSDRIFGFVNYSLKDINFAAHARVEISRYTNVMLMEASAAIARGAKVAIVVSGQKVVTAGEGQTVVGEALDKALASGNLIRVQILPIL